MTKKRGGQPANKNAKKVTPKKPIGLRLKADLVNRLKQEPDQTKLIEMLLTEYFESNPKAP